MIRSLCDDLHSSIKNPLRPHDMNQAENNLTLLLQFTSTVCKLKTPQNLKFQRALEFSFVSSEFRLST